MNNFSETWKSMSVEQRAHHIAKDWQDCRESNDPMVMRVAAVVAHAVLSEAIVELNTLRAERDEARRWVCELWSEHTPGNHVSPRDYAMEKGWHCFKEEP